MSLYKTRKSFGTVDRMLVACDPAVDGEIAADGVLATKWADMAHLRSTRECVIESATPTEFVFKGKCCRIAMTLIVCQIQTEPDQAVQYSVYGSNDGFAAENELLHSVTVIGVSEIYSTLDNEKVVNGVAEHYKDVRIEVTLNGNPIRAWVYLHRGIC